ncbi:MAG: malate dehydrogenase [Candidatus Scalindua sp.]|jgi:malate dehydrogenase|nr:malate dehydrogenase [Candidatus Scalindua sp.]
MKITVIGAGNVGATTAQRLAEKEFGDIVLVDIVEGLPQGKGLDLMEAGPIYNYDCKIIGTNSYEETDNSDLVVITSGLPRKPGMSRDDLVKVNTDIVKSVVGQVVEKSPDAILIVVSNPLDVMTYVTYKVSKFPRERVIGMAGVLDTSRMRNFIAMELNVSVENVHTFVLGGHGDTMVPLARYTTVAGIPVTELIPEDRLDAIVKRTRDGGAEIISLLKTESAFYAPAASIVEMIDSIVKDKKKILPCTVLCNGEYGFDDIFIGLPVKLGKRGLEQIIEIKLNKEESEALKKSADAVKKLCQGISF